MNRVALIADNSIEYVDLLLSIWENGDCAVLVDPQSPGDYISNIIKDLCIAKVFIDEKIYKREKNSVDCSSFVIFKSSEGANELPVKTYSRFHENYSKNDAVILFSSGTSGKSKGVVLSHFAINTNADAIIDYMTPTVDDCIYITKRIVHSSTFTGELLLSLKRKIPLVISQTTVHPRFILETISQFKVSIMCVNPWILSNLVCEKNKLIHDTSSLKKIYVSGSFLSERLVNEARIVFHESSIYNAYGQTEAGPRISAQNEHHCTNNSVGVPIKGVKVKILDSDLNEKQTGQYGFVNIKTKSLFTKYSCNGSAKSSVHDGWLNTGDIGYIDKGGELFIVGRADDMVTVNSHNVILNSIEDLIMSTNRTIKDCAVVCIQDESQDKLACLYCGEDVSPHKVQKKLIQYLMPYEIPRLYICTSHIPRNPNGKIERNIIKEVVESHIMETTIRAKVIDTCYSVLSYLGIPKSRIEKADFIELGMDSIAFVSLIIQIESDFNIKVPDNFLFLECLNNVDRIVKLVSQQTITKDTLTTNGTSELP